MAGGGLNAVERNYGAEADQVATDFDLPANYLKALIALESSGRNLFHPALRNTFFSD